MDGTTYVVLEAHARCATLYLRGPLSAACLERAVALCGALPPAVSDLRIDARALDADDDWTAAALRAVVRAWHATACDDGPARGAVTISLQDRSRDETASGHFPGDPRDIPAAPSAGRLNSQVHSP